MTRQILICAMLATLTSCAIIRRSHDWYHGPEHLRDPLRDAINLALTELPREIDRPLQWDWNRDRASIRLVTPAGHHNGIPYLYIDTRRAYGYTLGNQIVLPHGFRPGTLRHEAGHRVLTASGIIDRTGEFHHNLAPQFFRRHRAQ